LGSSFCAERAKKTFNAFRRYLPFDCNKTVYEIHIDAIAAADGPDAKKLVPASLFCGEAVIGI
jgi:hypothetical protein